MVIPDLEKELAKWSTECKELFVRDHLTEDNLARVCKSPTRDNFLLEYEPAFKIFFNDSGAEVKNLKWHSQATAASNKDTRSTIVEEK